MDIVERLDSIANSTWPNFRLGCEAMKDAAAEIQRLRRELEAAQADAARYRWLTAMNDGRITIVDWDDQILLGGHADAAIDAARSA